MKHFAYASKKSFLFAAVLFFAIFTTASAFAQDALPTAGEAMNSGSSKQAGAVATQKESVYDFDADDVEGTIVRPDEANITGEEHGQTNSLLQIRTNFISPELISSVDSIPLFSLIACWNACFSVVIIEMVTPKNLFLR